MVSLQSWTKAKRIAFDDFGIYLTHLQQEKLFMMNEGKQERETKLLFKMEKQEFSISQIAKITKKTKPELRTVLTKNRCASMPKL